MARPEKHPSESKILKAVTSYTGAYHACRNMMFSQQESQVMKPLPDISSL